MLIPQVKPPFKPVVKSDTDVSNFDEDFTSEPVKLSPPEGKATNRERLSSNIHSPDWSSYISLKNQSREFDKRSKRFPFNGHNILSHNDA